MVVSRDQRHAFVTGFGSSTNSSDRFDASAALALINSNAAFLDAKSQPMDLAQSANSQLLFSLFQ